MAETEVMVLGRDRDWHRRLDLGRLARLRRKLVDYDCAAGLFYDPINIRYATGVTNMQIYSLHNPCRYVFVAAEGPVILFEFGGCEFLADGRPAVDEVRVAKAWYHFAAGPRVQEFAQEWCAEILDLMRTHGGGNRRLAIDRIDPSGVHLLEASRIEIADGFEVAHMGASSRHRKRTMRCASRSASVRRASGA
jgi:Xaa-Pro aminopeptidase